MSKPGFGATANPDAGTGKARLRARAPIARAAIREHPAASSLERIVNQIKQGIRERRYAPGQRLIEADLAAELGVKRQPVRDALRVLAGDGIVQLIPQRGARVRKLQRDELREMIPVLAGLLTITVRLAIGKLNTPAIRARLQDAMDSMRHARRVGDLVQFHRAGMAYGEALHGVAGNRYLDYLHGKLHPDLFHDQLSSALHIESWDPYLEHFEQMHAALLAANLDQALELIAAHEQSMLAMLEPRGETVWR
ncbi:MAG: GntR family transcriptional regulator [Gammaproteobacteria bacterium]|nr:GntR family transcriptional regulator [Gammaproteobacteria bacterium]